MGLPSGPREHGSIPGRAWPINILPFQGTSTEEIGKFCSCLGRNLTRRGRHVPSAHHWALIGILEGQEWEDWGETWKGHRKRSVSGPSRPWLLPTSAFPRAAPPHHILLWVGYCWVWYCWDSLVPLGLCGNDGLSENLAVPVFWLESLGRFWLPWVVSIREEAPHAMGHLRLL